MPAQSLKPRGSSEGTVAIEPVSVHVVTCCARFLLRCTFREESTGEAVADGVANDLDTFLKLLR